MSRRPIRRLALLGKAGGGSAPASPTAMLLVTGQSNGSPNDSTVYSATPSTRHSRFTFGVRCRSTDALLPRVALYEQPTDTAYGSGETIASAFSATHDAISSNRTRWWHGNHAKISQPIAAIKKGGTATCYADGIAQATAGGTTPVYAVALIHGETDAQNNNTTYGTDLDTLQTNYDTDIKAITGQGNTVLVYASQCAAYPPGSTSATGATKTGSTHLTVLSKAVAAPTRFKCFGPLYPGVAYGIQSDGLHFTAAVTRIWGAYLAKFVNATQLGADDLPLYPTGAVRTGASVVVTFHVPVSPLVWRYDLFQPTTTGNTGALLGFKFFDDSGTPPAVTDVQITAANQVTVTLASTPTGTAGSCEIRIGHSTSQNSGTGGTPLTDSDTTADPRGWPLPNFCAMSYALTG